MTFNSCVSIGSIGSVELIGVTHPDELWVILNVVELIRVNCMTSQDDDSTHQLQIEITGYSEDVLDLTLLQALHDVLCEFDAHSNGVEV